MKYGIQLYSIRDVAEKSLEDAVKAAADIGYSSIEFAGFFGRTPQQVTEMLCANNIQLSGTHSSYDDLVNNFEETIAYHKAIGNKNYILPGVDLSNQQKLDNFVKNIGSISERLAAEGMTLSYHNHSHEFKANADGSFIYDQLLYRTDIKFEVDCYWAYVGMSNPIALLERVGERLTFIHLKDGIDRSGRPLGQGNAPLKEVHAWAVEHGVPMIVETDSRDYDGPTDARLCIEYLKSL